MVVDESICFDIMSRNIPGTSTTWTSIGLTVISISATLAVLCKVQRSFYSSSAYADSKSLQVNNSVGFLGSTSSFSASRRHPTISKDELPARTEFFMLPVYSQFLLAATVFYLVVIFYDLTLQESDARTVLATLLNAFFTFITNGLVFYLIMPPRYPEKYRRRWALIAAGTLAAARLGTEAYLSTSLPQYYASDGWTPFGDWEVLEPYWLWFNVGFAFAYLSLWAIARYLRRKAAEYLLSFMSVPFMLFSASRVMLLFDIASGWCVQVAGHVLFHVLFVPVLYYVAKYDSRERMKLGSLTSPMLGDYNTGDYSLERVHGNSYASEDEFDSFGWRHPSMMGRDSVDMKRVHRSSMNVTIPKLDVQPLEDDHAEGERIFDVIMNVPAISDLIIPTTDVQMQQYLGTGSFGEVFAARWQGTDVAVKHFHLRGGKANHEFDYQVLREFLQEARVMSRLRHPNVVQLYGLMVDDIVSKRCLSLVMELLNPTLLSSHLNPSSEAPSHSLSEVKRDSTSSSQSRSLSAEAPSADTGVGVGIGVSPMDAVGTTSSNSVTVVEGNPDDLQTSSASATSSSKHNAAPTLSPQDDAPLSADLDSTSSIPVLASSTSSLQSSNSTIPTPAANGSLNSVPAPPTSPTGNSLSPTVKRLSSDSSGSKRSSADSTGSADRRKKRSSADSTGSAGKRKKRSSADSTGSAGKRKERRASATMVASSVTSRALALGRMSSADRSLVPSASAVPSVPEESPYGGGGFPRADSSGSTGSGGGVAGSDLKSASPDVSVVVHFDWLQTLRVAAEIAQGMIYLHSRNIVHRDIKPHNILLDSQGRAKITDFGLSRIVRSFRSNEQVFESRGVFGTREYMAPEILNGQSHTRASDVYAFGIVLWQLFNRAVPYDGMRDITMEYHVIDGGRPPLSSDFNDFPESTLEQRQSVARLISACWHAEPDKRPTFQSILSILEESIQPLLEQGYSASIQVDSLPQPPSPIPQPPPPPPPPPPEVQKQHSSPNATSNATSSAKKGRDRPRMSVTFDLPADHVDRRPSRNVRRIRGGGGGMQQPHRQAAGRSGAAGGEEAAADASSGGSRHPQQQQEEENSNTTSLSSLLFRKMKERRSAGGFLVIDEEDEIDPALLLSKTL